MMVLFLVENLVELKAAMTAHFSVDLMVSSSASNSVINRAAMMDIESGTM